MGTNFVSKLKKENARNKKYVRPQQLSSSRLRPLLKMFARLSATQVFLMILFFLLCNGNAKQT
jgi:hypothetical protein